MFLSVVFIATACYRNESILLVAQKTVNSQCPKVIDKITTLKNVQYNINDRFFVYNYTIDETKCPMSEIKKKLDILANNVKSMLDTPENRAFLEACINAEVLVLFQYSGSESSEMCWITYYPKIKEVKIKRD